MTRLRRAAVAVEWIAWTLAAWAALSLAGCAAVDVPSFPAEPGVEPTPRPLAEMANEPGMVHATEDGTVVRVVDGDTLIVQVAGGQQQRVRVLGIDSPERGECGFREATEHLRETAPVGAAVVLTAETSQGDTDRYGRSLRYVRAGDRDLSSEQVMSGWAEVYAAYPVELTPMLDVMQGYAQRRGAGVWGMCR